MQAGRLDRRVSFDRKVITQDATYGSDVVAWVRYVTVQAEVQDALPSRSESVQQGLAIDRNQTRVRLRYRNDLTSDMRIILHGDSDVPYQIVGGPAEIGGRKRGLEIVCERYSS